MCLSTRGEAWELRVHAGSTHTVQIETCIEGGREYAALKSEGRVVAIKSLPRGALRRYVERVLNEPLEEVRIIRLQGARVVIDREVRKPGWLYFPECRLAVGVIFCGREGVLASARVCGRTAYFVPLDKPILHALDVAEIRDFY
jgi:hypothetical protein